jgi:hypothetical protein
VPEWSAAIVTLPHGEILATAGLALGLFAVFLSRSAWGRNTAAALTLLAVVALALDMIVALGLVVALALIPGRAAALVGVTAVAVATAAVLRRITDNPT